MKTVVMEQRSYPPRRSLPVPNVQELVKENTLHVPERYVRDEEDDMPKPMQNGHLSSELPIIDFSLLSNGHQGELKKLDFACQYWGFFQLINHGMTDELLQSMKEATAAFFSLPLEEKNKYAMGSDDIQGYGHSHASSEEQKLDWTDTLILTTHPHSYRNDKFWPTKPENFKEIGEVYSNEVRRVADELMGCISLNMGMERRVLLEKSKESMQGLRVNYYPPCSEPGKVFGLSPHSDPGTITVLLQDDHVEGLQLKHEGEWVPVKPIPNVLVVNVADVMEIWSNGKYKSVEHRAVTNDKRERITVAAYFHPDLDDEIEPFHHLVDHLNQGPPKLYKKMKFGDYFAELMMRKLEGKMHTELVKIQ